MKENHHLKTLLFIFMIWASLSQLFLISSCDAPRTSRFQSTTGIANSLSSGSSTNTNTNTSTSDDDDDDNDDDDDDNDDSSLSVPSGAKNCTWSHNGSSNFQFGAMHLDSDEEDSSDGAYNLCQNEESDTRIYFQIKNPLDDEQVCFIPTHSDGDTSTYIGNPRCLTASQNDQIYSIRLYKNRTGFSAYSINGVMVIRDKSYYFDSPYNTNSKINAVDAYIYCMQVLALYGNNSYCQAFASENHYLYHEF